MPVAVSPSVMQTAHATELLLPRVEAPRADRLAPNELDCWSPRISVGRVVLLIAVVAAVVLTVTVPVAEAAQTRRLHISGAGASSAA